MALHRNPLHAIGLVTLCFALPAFGDTPKDKAKDTPRTVQTVAAPQATLLAPAVAPAATVVRKVEGRTDTQATPPPGGPATGVDPGVAPGRGTTGSAPKTDKGDVADRAANIGTTQLRGELTGSIQNNATARPAFEQGISGQKDLSDADRARIDAGRGNPVGQLTGGQLVGGPLGDAANANTRKPPGGSSAAESGMVSSGQIGNITTPATFSDSEGVKSMGSQVRDAYSGGALEGVSNFITGNTTATNAGRELNQALCAEQGCKQPSTTAGATGKPGFERHASGNTTERTKGGADNAGGTTTHTTFDSQHRPSETMTITNNGDGSKTVTKTTTTYANDDDNRGTSTTTTTTATASSCPPDIDGCGARPSDRDIANRVNDPHWQIVQSAKAGGNVNPDRNDNATSGGNGGPITTAQGQNKLGLLGQPAAQGVIDTSGGSRGLDFNNKNLGAIDPGRDATITAGSHRDHNRADDALNGRTPSPATGAVQAPSQVGSNNASAEDDEDDTSNGGKTSSGNGGR